MNKKVTESAQISQAGIEQNTALHEMTSLACKGLNFTSIDEAPDLHDPYSDLSLFLAQQIKEEIQKDIAPKKWTLYLQDQLIKKIAPEFQKRFPKYRLGISALKKIWDKMTYFSHFFEYQKEALTPEGKLNIPFLIRENFKDLLFGSRKFSFHPYLLAQQLGLKISECLATYDGVRPVLQQMTKMIWSVQRHLIHPQKIPFIHTAYDKLDTWDKLILKIMLTITSQRPLVSQEELQTQVRQELLNLKDFPYSSLKTLIPIVSVTLANQLYKEAEFHKRLTDQAKSLIHDFFNQCSHLCNPIDSPLEMYYHIKSLYFTFQIQSLAISLRDLELDVLIWKYIEKVKSLSCYSEIKQKILEELGEIFVDYPKENFMEIVNKTAQFFIGSHTLLQSTHWIEMEHRTNIWTIQGELVYRYLEIEPNPLLELAQNRLPIQEIKQIYLDMYPYLISFSKKIHQHITIFMKYHWYKLYSLNHQSSLECFMQLRIQDNQEKSSYEISLLLEDLFKKQLPLIPFHQKYVLDFITHQQEKS